MGESGPSAASGGWSGPLSRKRHDWRPIRAGNRIAMTVLGPQPAPLCRFKGVRGEIEIPPRFSLGGRGGHSLFKREYPPGFSVPNRYSSAGNPGNLFGKTKRKWGFNPVRHSRTSPYQSGAFDVSKENVGCILRGKAALPAANRRLSTDRPGSAAYSCTGGRPGPGSARRWEWRGCGCLLLPRSGW